MLMRLLLVVVFFLSFVQAAELSADVREELASLTIITEPYPPLNYVEAGEIRGLSVELLQQVYQHLGVEIPEIQVIPWTRGYHIAQTDQPVLLFSTARTPARETLFQWAGPIYRSAVLLVTWQGSGIERYDPGMDQFEPVLAVRSDVSRLVLDEHQYPVERIIEADNPEQQYRLFIKKRVRLAAVSQAPFQQALAAAQEPDLMPQTLHVMKRTEGFYAFSLAVSPQAVAAVQQALQEISTQHTAILNSYNMSLD